MRRLRISSARRGVEEPLPVLFHQRNGKWPAVSANFQRHVGIRISDQLRLFGQVFDRDTLFLGGLDDIG